MGAREEGDEIDDGEASDADLVQFHGFRLWVDFLVETWEKNTDPGGKGKAAEGEENEGLKSRRSHIIE